MSGYGVVSKEVIVMDMEDDGGIIHIPGLQSYHIFSDIHIALSRSTFLPPTISPVFPFLFSLSFSKLVDDTLWFVSVYMYVQWWSASVRSFAASLNFYLKPCIYWLQVTAAPTHPPKVDQLLYVILWPEQCNHHPSSFIYRVW